MNIKLSNTIIISDPCYSREQANCDFKIKAGNYNVSVNYSYEAGCGTRVKSLAIFHESVKISKHGFKKNPDVVISVDSGQAGFFCDSIYPKGGTGEYSDDDSFYGQCCNATVMEDVASLKKDNSSM